MTPGSVKIPLSSPDIGEAEIAAVVSVLRGQRLSLGPKMEEFEQSMAGYTGVQHAIAVSSGTSGLHLCMRALNIGPGDQVILPSFTFIAAANVVRYQGATPVFVDVDPDTLNVNPEKIARVITSRTRMLLVVHTFGCPAEMVPIMELARLHNLLVVEDACEAIGAEYQGRKVGSFGDAGVFGFYPNKQITTGEGGMIVSGNAQLATRMRALRNQGRYDSDDWFQHAEVGYNYRISEINCALGREQLRRIDAILDVRESVAREYNRRLEGNPDLILPAVDLPFRRLSWFVYVVRLRDGFTQQDRDDILKELTEQGIGCGRYFAPIHLQPSYAEWHGESDLNVTENESARVIALPFFNRITSEEIDRVCSALRLSVGKRSARPREQITQSATAGAGR